MSNIFLVGIEEQFLLRVERELAIQLDSVLEKLQKLSKDYSIETDKEKSPFKNVLAAATETPTSLEVIKNFIRYQGGRKPSKLWEKPGFANALVQQLDSLSIEVDTILSRILQENNEKRANKIEKKEDCKLEDSLLEYIDSKKSDIQRSLHLHLAQLYLGYLSREHTARLGENTKDTTSANQAEPSHSKIGQSSDKPIRK